MLPPCLLGARVAKARRQASILLLFEHFELYPRHVTEVSSVFCAMEFFMSDGMTLVLGATGSSSSIGRTALSRPGSSAPVKEWLAGTFLPGLEARGASSFLRSELDESAFAAFGVHSSDADSAVGSDGVPVWKAVISNALIGTRKLGWMISSPSKSPAGVSSFSFSRLGSVPSPAAGTSSPVAVSFFDDESLRVALRLALRERKASSALLSAATDAVIRRLRLRRSDSFRAVSSLIRGESLCLLGARGVGKTSLAMALADVFGVVLDRFGADATTNRYDLVGGRNGSDAWFDGDLTRSARGCSEESPRWFLFDECTRCDAGSALGPMFMALSDAPSSRRLSLPGHPSGDELSLDASFRFLMAGNPSDGHCVEGLLSPALLDRFSTLRLFAGSDSSSGCSGEELSRLVSGALASSCAVPAESSAALASSLSGRLSDLGALFGTLRAAFPDSFGHRALSASMVSAIDALASSGDPSVLSPEALSAGVVLSLSERLVASGDQAAFSPSSSARSILSSGADRLPFAAWMLSALASGGCESLAAALPSFGSGS